MTIEKNPVFTPNPIGMIRVGNNGSGAVAKDGDEARISSTGRESAMNPPVNHGGATQSSTDMSLRRFGGTAAPTTV